MSQVPHETMTINIPDAGIGDHQYPPQSVPIQAPLDVSNFVDGSGPIFSMYLEMATEEDKKMTDNWKADADGILIFTGLFSAAVASLISVSIQDIRQNPQDTSNFYLANIYQTLADPNRANISSSLPASPPPFSPPTYAVWVNALWFLSLVISLTCALLATLLQQWARKYLKVTQSRYTLDKRARIRAFLAEGVDKLLLPWTVEALPTLLHISLFLFFAGLVVFLWNVNLTIFKLVLSWVGICMALYGCITVMPIFRHDSPYLTPLSFPAWHIVTGISFLTFRALRRLARNNETSLRFNSLVWSYRRWLVQGMQKTVEETALRSSSEIDTRAFLWTFDSLDEDHELERFFSGLPGFRNSKLVDDPLPNLTIAQRWKLWTALSNLLDRSFSSDVLPAPVKKRRAMLCAKATDPAYIPAAFGVFDKILYHVGDSLTAEILQIVRGWSNDRDDDTILVAQATVSSIVARAKRRDDSWFILASNELGLSESVLRDYAAHGDSLSLAVLIHITRQQSGVFRKDNWMWLWFSHVLDAASKFDVRDASRELQHEFCTLWNQVVLDVRNGNEPMSAWCILRPIRNIYASLHRDTGSAPIKFSASTGDNDDILNEPSSYPLCNIPDHHPESTPHFHDVFTSTTFAHPVLHDDAALAATSIANTSDVSPSSVPATGQANEYLMDVPLLDNNMASFHLGHQTAMEENLFIPSTSPVPAAAGATPDLDISDRTMLPATPEIPTSYSSVPSIGAVVPQNNAKLLAPSDAPNTPSPASPEPVLAKLLPTATTSPGTSPWPTSAPGLGAATREDGSMEVGSRRDEDALDPPLVNRAFHADNVAILDFPPQLQPLSLANDVAIAGSSHREPDAGHAGDHLPQASHVGRYDVV